jgi:hypothetical protein
MKNCASVPVDKKTWAKVAISKGREKKVRSRGAPCLFVPPLMPWAIFFCPDFLFIYSPLGALEDGTTEEAPPSG